MTTLDFSGIKFFTGTFGSARFAQAGPCDQSAWGEAFAEDSLAEIACVSTWDLCSSDEYLRLFPRLVLARGKIDPAVTQRLTECLAVYAWRARMVGKSDFGADVSFIGHGMIEALGHRHEREWFPKSRSFTSRFQRKDDQTGRQSANDFMLFLDRLLQSHCEGRTLLIDAEQAVLFAYHSGVNPAYVWAEEALSSARNTTAGWLGILARGRAAFMPLDVAEYFVDMIDAQGVNAARDSLIHQMVPLGQACIIRASANRRLNGEFMPILFRQS